MIGGRHYKLKLGWFSFSPYKQLRTWVQVLPQTEAEPGWSRGLVVQLETAVPNSTTHAVPTAPQQCSEATPPACRFLQTLLQPFCFGMRHIRWQRKSSWESGAFWRSILSLAVGLHTRNLNWDSAVPTTMRSCWAMKELGSFCVSSEVPGLLDLWLDSKQGQNRLTWHLRWQGETDYKLIFRYTQRESLG